MSTLAPEFVAHLLEAPKSVLDESAKVMIRKWDSPPKALQVLEVLDQCVHSALASRAAMQLLEFMLADAIKAEGVTYEKLVTLATWRT